MSSVAIIDDHAVLADCLALAIQSRGIADVRTIDPGCSAPLDVLGADWPDLCLLDLDLGDNGHEGLELIAPLTAHGVAVVVLTGAENEALFGTCLELGAVGVLGKGRPLDEIVDCISSALGGNDVNSHAELYRWMLATSQARTARERSHAPFSQLTTSEAEVLAALVDGQSVDQIACGRCVSVKTVRSQVRSVLQKLGVHSQLAAVAMAYKAGWTPPLSEAS